MALALADVAAILGLHAMDRLAWAKVDWTAPTTWLQRAPDEVVLAGLRIVALAGAYWLAAAIAIGAVCAVRSRQTSVSWYEIPAVRRLVERALAVSVTVTTTASALTLPALSGVAGATQDGSGPLPPIPVVVDQAEPAEPAEAPPSTDIRRMVPAGPPVPAPGAGVESMSPEVMRMPVVASAQRPGDYVVQPGDSLWSIAADYLATAHDDPPCESEVAAYWAALVEANRARLRSGDPDLIFPGEHVQLVGVVP